MRAYTVGQLAKTAGVSVRTLHHYDHIGLLKPRSRTPAGYRLYEEQDLLRLQQILFFRELDLSLSEIRGILDDPAFDQVQALDDHRRILQARARRLTNLIATIDKTIRRITEDNTKMTDEELYEGFSRQQIERYRREAREMYDPALVQESERRLGRMSKTQWKAVREEGDEITRLLADLADGEPEDPQVQTLIARHHAWLDHFFTASADVYCALGQGYAEHPEFRRFYDRYRLGLADFMAAAMAYYAEHTLSGD